MSERRFILRNEFVRDNLLAFIKKLPFDMEVVIKPWIEQRSLTQNNRLWALHTAAGNFVGCSAEDMHDDMLCKFYGYREVPMPSGDVKRVPLKRSSQRNKKEFAEFMEQVEAFYISELGVWLDKDAA